MSKKNENKPELDMETTIVDMNVEGFSWYDPKKKNAPKTEPKTEPVQLTKKEYRALIRGAYRAMLPIIGCILAGALFVILLAYIWLQ